MTIAAPRLQDRLRTALVRLGIVAYAPNALPLAVIGFYTAAVIIAGKMLAREVGMTMYVMSLIKLTPATVIPATCVAAVYVLIRDRPERPTAYLFRKLSGEWQIGTRLLRGAPIVLLLPPMLSSFTSFKGSIGHVVPFYFDPYAAAADRFIHGIEPWRLLQPLLGFPQVTYAISIAYATWFFAMYAIISYAMFISGDLRSRSQYLASFVLCWGLIGSLAASLLASAGPCFYLELYGGHDFDGLMAYLDSANAVIPNHVREVQSNLLKTFRAQETAFAAGISAMPSLHVAIAVLNGIYLSHVNRYAAFAAWVFALVISIGSIHLGWHYAVDGYVSAAMVVLIWNACGWLTDNLNLPTADRSPGGPGTGATARY